MAKVRQPAAPAAGALTPAQPYQASKVYEPSRATHARARPQIAKLHQFRELRRRERRFAHEFRGRRAEIDRTLERVPSCATVKKASSIVRKRGHQDDPPAPLDF